MGTRFTDPSARRWWALGATALSLLVVGLDSTVLTVALPSIAIDLHATNGQLQWFVDAYLLALSGLLLPAGTLGDRFGRKRLMLGALAVFGLGSLWCAWASSPAMLIAARTLLGVGAAVLIPMAMSSLVVMFEPHERRTAVSVMGASTMLGLPLGPIIAGLLLQHFWWGSVFLINVPVVIVALIATAVLVPESRSGQAGRFDLLGVVLSVVGLVSLTYGIIQGPDRGWADPVVLLTISLGLVVLVTFVLWERAARGVEPILDLVVWRDRAFRWGSIAAAIASLAFFGVMFAVPLYLRAVEGTDPLATGVRTLPLLAGLLVGIQLAVRIGARTAPRVVTAAGFAIVAIGTAIGALTTVSSGYGRTALWTTIVGLGMGLALVTAQTAALDTLSKDKAGAGSALVQTLRQAASVIGIAVLGAILNGVYRGQVEVHGLAPSTAAAVRDSVASGVQVAHLAHAPALLESVRSAYVEGMSALLWVSAAVAVIGAVLAARFLSATPPQGEGVTTAADPAADPAQSGDVVEPAASSDARVG